MDTPRAPTVPNAGFRPARLPYHLLAILLALAGGVAGIFGAFIEELRTGGGLLLIFLGAPIIEEALKPTGVYLLLIRWPQLVRSQLYTAFLAALGGLTFGLVEAFVYVTLYVPDHSEGFLVYRFTAPLLLHTAASFIVGLGINRGIIDWVAGRSSLPRRSRNLYIAAVTLHAVFNLVAVILTLAGPLDVD